MNITDKLKSYDPNAPGITSNNIFGLPFNVDEAKVVIIPIPWDATVSSKPGTCYGPAVIKEQSYQIDLFDPAAPDMWKNGIAMEDISEEIFKKNLELRFRVEKFVRNINEPVSHKADKLRNETINTINEEYDAVLREFERKAIDYLDKNKLVVLIGGEHSTSIALKRAIAKKYDNFGILQLDAHADLRDSYEGFRNSHASVMFNALKLDQLKQLVQVGVRDYCQEEVDVIKDNNDKIKLFDAKTLYSRLFNGISWSTICDEIINELPEKVYISFDVDFLDPAECPNTGTPVPGGFSYEQSLFLIEKLVEKGKRIVGFDLVETGQGEIDGIVSCRLLYRMINSMLKSNKFVGNIDQ